MNDLKHVSQMWTFYHLAVTMQERIG